jgi:hypothetical protein
VDAHEGAPVDEERGSGPHTERPGLRDVGFDVAGEASLGQAPGERVPIEPQLDGVSDQAIFGESRLLGEEAVVVGPVSSRGAGTPRRLGGPVGLAVRGQREVFRDQAHPAIVLLENLLQRPLDAPAVGSLEVEEFHDRETRTLGPPRHRGGHRQVYLSRHGREDPDSQE